MKKIIPGSTIIGASGKKLIVEREARHQGGRVEGDTIYSRNLDTGIRSGASHPPSN